MPAKKHTTKLEEQHQKLRQALLRKIRREITAHSKTWCSPQCTTFIAEEYRRFRLEGCSAKEVQTDYDLCHVWR